MKKLHRRFLKISYNFCQNNYMQSVAQLCLTLCNPIDYSPPGSSVYEILEGQEYWSGLPFPSPGDLPSSRIEPESPALQGDSLPSEQTTDQDQLK